MEMFVKKYDFRKVFQEGNVFPSEIPNQKYLMEILVVKLHSSEIFCNNNNFLLNLFKQVIEIVDKNVLFSNSISRGIHLDQEFFWSKTFYSCKIVSSKIGIH